MVYDYEYSTSARILASNLPSGAKNNRKNRKKTIKSKHRYCGRVTVQVEEVDDERGTVKEAARFSAGSKKLMELWMTRVVKQQREKM